MLNNKPEIKRKETVISRQLFVGGNNPSYACLALSFNIASINPEAALRTKSKTAVRDGFWTRVDTSTLPE
jgi:hypothetical protein